MNVGTAQPATNPAENSADPSMEDILASIRRILSEDEPSPTPPVELPAPDAKPTAIAAHSDPTSEDDDDVLMLDETMMVKPEPAPIPSVVAAAPPPPIVQSAIVLPPTPPPAFEPPPPVAPGALLADETETAAAASLSQMMRSLTSDRQLSVHRGGPTLEDMVLETMRPLLKAWLDQNLPPLVERLVRNEIERVAARASGE